MSTETQYSVSAPVGSIIVPKEKMNAKELREFALQLIQDDEANAVWREKVQKDEIESVIEWLETAGYQVKLA